MGKMKEYDLFIPTSYNSGLPIEGDKLGKIQDDLVLEFHGLSVFDPCNGYWRGGVNAIEEVTYHDLNYIFRVVAEDSAEVHAFMQALKVRLAMLLEQESIFIIVRDVEIL